jgi:hypothetical protein
VALVVGNAARTAPVLPNHFRGIKGAAGVESGGDASAEKLWQACENEIWYHSGGERGERWRRHRRRLAADLGGRVGRLAGTQLFVNEVCREEICERCVKF